MQLSVNLNKIALLRNSRGNDTPSLIEYALLCIELGVDGLTLHPRPDHRHATSEDAIAIAKICKKNNIEFNLEGNPFSLPTGAFQGFQNICNLSTPNQITLVPDSLDQITSDHGWQPDYLATELKDFLLSVKNSSSRSSLFIDIDLRAVEYAGDIGFERVEFYTGPFAHYVERNDIEKINKIKKELTRCIDKAKELNLGINAGHDLNLDNLSHLKECGIIDEVSIGHAIMTDALKFGFSNTIMKYLESIRNN